MTKQKIGVKLWHIRSIHVEKLAFKDDGVYYKEFDKSAIVKVPYKTFIQAMEQEEGFTIMIKTLYTSGDFIAVSTKDHKHPDLLVCTRKHAGKIIVNKSLVSITDV